MLQFLYGVNTPQYTLYIFDDRVLYEYGAVGGMKIEKRTRSTGRKPAPCHFVHHKSHMT
jgi:hypothetical protein